MPSLRRYHIDKFLYGQLNKMTGSILDIGGKKENKRGEFKPLLSAIESWKYVNLDFSTNPDYLCSAESIPLSDNSVDGFLLCEVLEHLENPELVLREAFRLLKKDGRGWITMPFLAQVHADPDDYQRWTDIKLYSVLDKIGYKNIIISPMGGVFSVFYDLWYASLCRSNSRGSLLSKIWFRLYTYSRPLFLLLDKSFRHTQPWITTGWSITLVK
jgi:SAM-dependent methyltransferase